MKIYFYSTSYFYYFGMVSPKLKEEIPIFNINILVLEKNVCIFELLKYI